MWKYSQLKLRAGLDPVLKELLSLASFPLRQETLFKRGV